MSIPQPGQQPSWAQQPQPGQPYPPQPGLHSQQWQPPQPPKKKPSKTLLGCGGCVGVVALFVVIAAVAVSGSKSSVSSSGSSRASSSSGSTKTPATAAPRSDTVTYIVTGTSGADVTYGPAGSSLQGSVPMDKTEPLGNPQYYSITAQLQGGGSVTCKLEVDGKVISQSTATGGYNIAECEISQDPFSGKWTDTNKAG